MKNKNSKSKFINVIILVFLILWALTTIFPFVWIFISSFKTSRDIMSNAFSLPTSPTLQNYINAFSKQNILRSYGNSMIISSTVTLFVVLLSAMSSFVMTRYNFKGKKIVSMLFIGSLMFPAFATIIPIFRIAALTNSINTYRSVIIPQIAGNLSFAIIVLSGFMASLPIELEEAAFMEGSGVTRIFFKIILPLSKPSLAAVSIFTFLWSYNDLFLQIVMLRKKEVYPISMLLNEISSQFGTDFGLMAAAVTLVVIPVLVVYIFLQNNIIKGMTAGALKG